MFVSNGVPMDQSDNIFIAIRTYPERVSKDIVDVRNPTLCWTADTPCIKVRPTRMKAFRPGFFFQEIMFRMHEWFGLGHVCAG